MRSYEAEGLQLGCLMQAAGTAQQMPLCGKVLWFLPLYTCPGASDDPHPGIGLSRCGRRK